MSKWAKKEDAELVQTISDLFNCSIKKAEQLRDTLGAKVVAEIVTRSKKMYGGIQNAK